MPAEVKPYHLVEAGQKESVIFFGKVLTKKRVSQKNCYNYYPFGLSFNSFMDTTETAQNYKYNGKELQTDLGLDWYDYGARMYDASLGRFMVQDAFAENYYEFAPYQYAVNNPILYVDVNGDSIDLSNLSEEARAAYDAQISKLSENKMFKAYYNALENSEITYIMKSGKGDGGSGSFNPETNEVYADFESAYAVAQELFHAFQSDLDVYSSEDQSVRETEADIVSGNVALSVGEVSMAGEWDPGIGFKYSDSDLNFNNSVFSKKFDADFNKAVDSRIEFYKKRELVDGVKAPKSYVQKNSGIGAVALKKLVQMITER